MSKQKAGHPGMNAQTLEGKKLHLIRNSRNEQLTETQRQNNKKRKKNQ